MEVVNAGHMMSLAALQRQDPYINKLLDVTGQVALYNFNSMTNEWEKTEIEGTLFVYTRTASPHHGFTIMNRLSTENLVEPINKDLEFQLQDPFLLYRNGSLGIYSIWFYDKRDCQRIAQLMVKIVKQEADHAQRDSPERAEPGRSNGVAEPRPIDILELLSKAKEEYQKSRDTDGTTEPHVKTAINYSEHSPRPQKPSSHSIVKQITVEELFGSSLPKDSPQPPMPAPTSTISSGHTSTTYIQGTAPNQRHQVPGLLPAPYALHPSPVFQSVVPITEDRSLCSVSPLVIPLPPDPEPCAAPTSPATTAPSAPGVFLGQEIFSTLKPTATSKNPDIHKPILAPSFLPSTLVPPHSFQEPMGNPHIQHSKEMDVFAQPPNLIKPMSAVPMSPALAVSGPVMSVLLSPSAFQQSVNKTTAAPAPVPALVVLPAPTESPSTNNGPVEPPPTLGSKTQLQETLIHLIKNDADFLSTIHEAYLQTLSKDFGNIKL